ncbi:MAG: HEPN domain-containing protein [Eubacteriales bacterium]
MNINEKYAYWLMLSDYDLATIDCLVKGERWVYVAFLCQQSVERQLKGMYLYYNNAEAPKTHNVNFLFLKIVNSEKLSAHPEIERFNEGRAACEDFLIDLMFYFISDYPFSYKNIMNRFVNKDNALALLEKTKETLVWLRSFQPDIEVPQA